MRSSLGSSSDFVALGRGVGKVEDKHQFGDHPREGDFFPGGPHLTLRTWKGWELPGSLFSGGCVTDIVPF